MANENENLSDVVVDDFNLFDEGLRGWNGESGPIVPAGDYEVEVIEAGIGSTKDGKGRNLELTHKVVGGEHDGTELKQWLKLPGPSDKKGVAMRLAHVVRDVLGVQPIPGTTSWQPSQLVGCRMIIEVATEEQKTVEVDSITNEEKVTIKSRTSIKNERAAAPSAPAAAPSAPPASKAAVQATPTRKPAAAPPATARR
jgi:hypothetical protein